MCRSPTGGRLATPSSNRVGRTPLGSLIIIENHLQAQAITNAILPSQSYALARHRKSYSGEKIGCTINKIRIRIWY